LEKFERCMHNSRVFRSLGIKEATEVLKRSGPKAINASKATNAAREDSGSLYQPEDGEDVEQGVLDMQDLVPEVNKSSTQSACTSTGGSRTSKRVMAVALQEQDLPPRITRQRTRELDSTPKDTTLEPQDDSTADGLMTANANTETNNQNELTTEGK
jgi:hypothetical protein